MIFTGPAATPLSPSAHRNRASRSSASAQRPSLPSPSPSPSSIPFPSTCPPSRFPLFPPLPPPPPSSPSFPPPLLHSPLHNTSATTAALGKLFAMTSLGSVSHSAAPPPSTCRSQASRPMPVHGSMPYLKVYPVQECRDGGKPVHIRNGCGATHVLFVVHGRSSIMNGNMCVGMCLVRSRSLDPKSRIRNMST